MTERSLAMPVRTPQAASGDVPPDQTDFREEGGTPAAEPLAARVRRLYRGRWQWAAALGVVFAVPLGILGWRCGRQAYAAVGQVHVAPYADDYGFGGPNERALLGFESYDAFVDTQVQFLHTSRVIERAMDTPAWRGLGRPYSDDAVRAFAQNMHVTRKGEVLTIEFLDPDPNAAMAGARGAIDAYAQLAAEEDGQRGKDKLDFLQAELARSMNRLSDLDAAINAALQGLKGHQGFGVDDLLPLFAGKLTEATALEGRLREVRWALSVRGKDVRGASSTPAPLVPVPLAANPSPTTTRPTSNLADAAGPADLSPEQIAMENSQMAMYLNQQREAGGTLRRLRQTYFPGHPLLKAAEDELQTISGAIREFAVQYNARRARQGLAAYDPTSTVALEQLEANLTQSLQQTNNDLEALARLKRQVLNIREQIEQEKQNRDDLKRRIAAQDRLSRTPGRIQVMEIPSKPDRAETDSRPQFAAAGAAGGIVGGFAIVLIVGLMERRLRAAEDAGRFGMGDRPVIGLLPEIPEDLADPEKAVHAAYCVHGIRTSLQLWYGWLDRPVFAVSGAVSGTGKTTLTLALGLSFATARSRTLLIDFDLVGGGLTRRTSAVRRRPIGQLLRRAGMVQEPQLNDALARASAEGVLLGEMLVRLGYSRETDVAQALQRQRSDGLGVLDVLDGAKLEDCVVPTDVEHLAILPLGGAQAHHVGRVSPLATQRLIDAARAAYDVVLIDTGPVTGSLEAAAAAAAADGVLVTVSRGDAHAALARCAARLQSAGGRIAGVVFNRATARDFAAYERDGGSASGTVSWADRSSRPSRVAGGADEGAEAPFGEAALNGRFGPFGRAVAMAARPDTPAHR